MDPGNQTDINQDPLGVMMDNIIFNTRTAVRHEYSHGEQSQARIMGDLSQCWNIFPVKLCYMARTTYQY
jgi:hypothetical protein